jgi:ribosome recycling factor
MIKDIQNDTTARMHKSIEVFKEDMAKVRTGRAHPSLLQHILVPYYGSDVPLQQVANVAVGDARTLTITAYEKNMVSVIEKAIMTSDLGLMPATAGTVIRVPLPPLTEERRRDLTKVVRHEAENTRVAIRNIRRDAISMIKDLLKDKEVTEDEARRGEDSIQKITDERIAEVDKLLEAKEKELMEV